MVARKSLLIIRWPGVKHEHSQTFTQYWVRVQGKGLSGFSKNSRVFQ